MSKYIVVMDVSGDVAHSVVETKETHFIPMEYSLGDEMRVCNTMETDEQLKLFYDGQRNGDLTKTSQINPFLYQEYMKPYFEQGYSVVCLCLSSGLSSTYQSACLAKVELKEAYPDLDFYPVDSLGATGGMGVLYERAIKNLENGMTAEENAEDLQAAARKIRHWFMVQDLMYLKRGGRVSAATALIGTALNVKPILKVNEVGRLDTFDKKRGTKKALAAVLDNFKETYDETSDDPIYIIDSDDKSLSDALEKSVKELYPDKVIRRATLSPIIGAHTGPGMAAICHIGK